MIFACDRCGRRYSVPDERIQGRAFRVTCKNCANVIVVRPLPAPAVDAPAAPPQGAQGARASPAKTSSAAIARPASGSSPPSAIPSDSTGPKAPGPKVAVRPLPTEVPAPAPAVGAQMAHLAPTGPAKVANALEAPIPAPSPEVPLAQGPEVAQILPAAATPPPAPTPPAAVVERAPAIDLARGLSKAEMAWMSREGSTASALQEEGNLPRAEAAGSPPVPHRPPRLLGKRLLRIALGAVILCGLAALASKLVWPGLGRPRPPLHEASAPSPPPPAPPVVTETPEPAPPQEPPQPAPSPEGEAAPSPPPGPIRLGPRAHLEPGTVTVDKFRRAERQRLDRNDRRLLDLLARKQDGPAPPEPVERLDLDAGSLAPAAVERVMADNQGAFSGCVTREAKRGAGQRARRATLFLTVGGNGEVATAWVAEPDVSRTGLGKCISTAARRLIFPAFEGGAVDVSVPLVLEAR